MQRIFGVLKWFLGEKDSFTWRTEMIGELFILCSRLHNIKCAQIIMNCISNKKANKYPCIKKKTVRKAVSLSDEGVCCYEQHHRHDLVKYRK